MLPAGGRAVYALLVALVLAACAPVVQPAGPTPEGRAAIVEAGVPSAGIERFRTADGLILPLRRWLPDGDPRR